MMNRYNRSQIAFEVFKYVLVAFFCAIVLFVGYKAVTLLQDKTCRAEIAKFEIELKKIDKSIRYGVKELRIHQVPCDADMVYLFDLSKNIDYENFDSMPIMREELKTGTKNIFLVKENELKHSMSAGIIEIESAYLCLKPIANEISFFIEGAGNSVKVTVPEKQRLC